MNTFRGCGPSGDARVRVTLTTILSGPRSPSFETTEELRTILLINTFSGYGPLWHHRSWNYTEKSIRNESSSSRNLYFDTADGYFC